MRLTSIDIFTVVVPTIPGSVHSASFGQAGWDEIPKQIIRLNSDEHVYGLGEAIRGTTVETLRSLFARSERNCSYRCRCYFGHCTQSG